MLVMASITVMLKIAKKLLPDYVTLVPEKREEITTEGGLDVKSNAKYLCSFSSNLVNYNINNLRLCNFLLAIIGRLPDCLET